MGGTQCPAVKAKDLAKDLAKDRAYDLAKDRACRDALSRCSRARHRLIRLLKELACDGPVSFRGRFVPKSAFVVSRRI